MSNGAMPLAAPRRFGQTMRRDNWWVEPVLTGAVFLGFIVYATWAAFQNAHYTYGPYLSPFYSPEIFGDSPHALFGPKPGWWPAAIPFSPALLILWAPGGFRFTCYYYRGAYYKALWGDPPSCAVGERGKKYRGENSFPLIIQNLHRYFLYVALAFILFLAWDVVKATQFADPARGGTRFGVGLGTLVLLVNVILLGGYTLSCHSLRHLVGGGLDEPSKSPLRMTAWNCSSCLNRRHMNWAWPSLFWVAFSDIYVRLCSMGIWHDWRIF